MEARLQSTLYSLKYWNLPLLNFVLNFCVQKLFGMVKDVLRDISTQYSDYLVKHFMNIKALAHPKHNLAFFELGIMGVTQH